MKVILLKLYRFLVMFGFDPIKTINSIKGLPYYFRNLILLKKQQKKSMQKIPFGRLYPCLNDRFFDSGEAKGHYFHQDLLIASRVHQNNPKLHIDIGSRVDGFVAHVASFRKIKVLDIRPLSNKILNVEFVQTDLMSPLINELYECCDSLSCLHAMEHFGLGRYGDYVDYDGYLHGLENLYKILKKGGKLYFSVPIGPQRIEFDAHRVFSINYLLELFENKYQIDHFSYVDDDGILHSNVTMTDVNENFGCKFGCGIFEMTKL